MPRHKTDPHDWPSLNQWLYSLGYTDQQIKENFFYSALVDYFPGPAKGGSHRVPTEFEIEKERFRLQTTLETFRPEIVVPIGKLSIAYCLDEKIPELNKIIGRKFVADPYKLMGREVVVVPLPHPSGASTWKYQKKNKELLLSALNLLKKNISG